MTKIKKMVLASNNPGKLREFKKMFSTFRVKIIPQNKFKITAAKETGKTFFENALIKARYASRKTGLPAIADDSGLEVDILKGAPGVKSARYAGAHATSTARIQKLLRVLKEVPLSKRGAQFHCALVFVRNAKDKNPMIAEGIWRGRILKSPRGKKGFGYDPVFYIPSLKKTAAELFLNEKNKRSHRAKAMKKLYRQLPFLMKD